MEVVEFGPMPASARADLIGDEEDPFEMTRVTMQFRPKERHVGLRDEAGRLVAATGTVMSEVTVGRRSFPVAGIGGVIVVAAQRGRGLGRRVVEEALARAGSSRAEHAMLFCLPTRVGFYLRLSFSEITEEVQARQPGGYAVVPLCAMWGPLRDGAKWPPGPVFVEGLPF